MGNKNILNDDGQSTVEYILLLAVVISLVYTVISSERFKALFGDGGSFPQQMKQAAEWNYRFGSQGNIGFTTIAYPNATHPTYWNSSRGSTHFIGPLRPYP